MAERPEESIRILAPTTEGEWRHADTLIDELREWDVGESRALGFQPHEVLSVFYPEEIGDIREDSAPPHGRLLLAMDGGRPLGCVAFRQMTSSTCEVYGVFVRPDGRGRGIGSMLLRQLQNEARIAGYRSMWLETATFMRNAHRLYRAHGFRVRDPYRTVPKQFADATMWMECALDLQPAEGTP
jgi:ribosomal protein S18 acetylase RimI-like enzyme